MPKIEVIAPSLEEGEDPRKPIAAYGHLVKVDGRELPHVRSLQLRFDVNDLVIAEAVLLVDESFHYEAGADVHVSIDVPKGYRLVEETRKDGSKVYRGELDS